MPKASPTPTTTPSPSSTPLGTMVLAKADLGETVYLAISGNVTSFQMSNVTIASNESANSTIMSFTVTGEKDTIGFSNITIPKIAIPYGTNPVILIDDQQATNQGYTQNSNNFFVWYTTHFSTHQVKVYFAVPSTSQVMSFGSILAVCLTVPEIILIYTVIAVRRLRRKPENS
jgi:hypothetical protein